MTQIKVPTLGESVTEATVAQWLKKVGDSVSVDEPVVELETDKVTLEVNAPEKGVLKKIIVSEGENVEVGAVLCEIDVSAAANDIKPNKDINLHEKNDEAGKYAPKEDKKTPRAAVQALSPAVRKMVEDNSLNPDDIKGSGKDGRILKEDVLNIIEAKSETSSRSTQETIPNHKPDGFKSKPGQQEERVRMTRLRQSIAKRLKDAQNTAAILTTFNEVDMSAVMLLRKDYKDRFEKKHGIKLGFMSFFVKATVSALKDIPAVNSEIDGDELIYKNYYDLGVAVSTPQGLIVPVIRDCADKSMAQIEKDIVDVGTRAREGKISIEEMQGGTFTITNGGVFGSLMSTPILNAPQSGILGMHKIQQRPMVMPDGSILARPMMYLALSYDHRVIDGKEAVTFLVKIKEVIEDPHRLLLNI